MPTITPGSQDDHLGSLQSSVSPEDFEPSAIPAGLLTPQGGPVSSPTPRKLPLAIPEQFVCLRGPCRYLMTTTSPAEVENDDYEPVATDRYCKAIPGVILELSETAVYSCSDWDPASPNLEREKRRAAYRKSPEGRSCANADDAREAARKAARDKIDLEHSAREQKRKLDEATKQIQIEAGTFDPQEE